MPPAPAATATNPLLAAALEYAGYGWRVVPLRPREKVPRLPKWPEAASADAGVVGKWWREVPTGNVGVALGSGSGVVGIDLDGPHATAALAELAGGDLPDTLEFSTANGARLLYAVPPGLRPRTVEFKVEGGELKLMSDGKQTVMPPSVHPGDPARGIAPGFVYHWVPGRGPGQVAAAPMPSWLLAEMCRPEEAAWADPPTHGPADAFPPGADLNRRGDWDDALRRAGYRPAGGRGEVRYWTRPGKRVGASVTVGHYRAKDGTAALHCFSSNAPGLAAGKTYDLFGFVARAEFRGDFGAAAKALAARGYGTPRPANRLNGYHRNGHANGDQAGVETLVEDGPGRIETAADVAGIADLKRSGAKLEWVWPGWIQRGVITLIAAEGGTGKTRLAADLVRRVRRNELWPEGTARAVHDGPVVALWVVADNHHGEMVSLCEAFGIDDCVKVNAGPADPYGGVSLETAEDFAALEQRVKVCRPLLVVVDTVGNATDRNLSRQEDAKAFYQPLQLIARKQKVAVVCLTHLNAGGTVLGRRGTEKVRTLIRMTAQDITDPKCRRRLEVVKSNSVAPPAVGVTMKDLGNEYDANPPPPPDPHGGTSDHPPTAVRECMEWLAAFVKDGPRRVGDIRDEAERKGVAVGTLYSARRVLRLAETKVGRHKFWSMEGDEPEVDD